MSEAKAVIANLRSTLKKFLASPDFQAGVISASKAAWGGGGYSVELFPDGTWRVLSDSQIGNLYESKGIILSLPEIDFERDEDNEDLSDEECLVEAWDWEEDSAREELNERFDSWAEEFLMHARDIDRLKISE